MSGYGLWERECILCLIEIHDTCGVFGQNSKIHVEDNKRDFSAEFLGQKKFFGHSEAELEENRKAREMK